MKELGFFTNVGLSEIDTIRKFLWSGYPMHSVFSAMNCVLWGGRQNMQYTIIDDILLFRTEYEDEIRYCTPDSRGRWDTVLSRIEKEQENTTKPFRIAALSSSDVKSMKIHNHYSVSLTTDNSGWDYVYKIDDLVNLEGHAYGKHRNMIRRFYREYSLKYEKVTNEHIEECLGFCEKWYGERKKRLTQKEIEWLDIEKSIMEVALKNFDILRLTGDVFLIDGKIVGIIIGEKLNNDTYVMHFEKANVEYKGIYETIRHTYICEELANEYVWLNLEEDMGIANIRKSKQSYKPYQWMPKYSLHFCKEYY